MIDNCFVFISHLQIKYPNNPATAKLHIATTKPADYLQTKTCPLPTHLPHKPCNHETQNPHTETPETAHHQPTSKPVTYNSNPEPEKLATCNPEPETSNTQPPILQQQKPATINPSTRT